MKIKRTIKMSFTTREIQAAHLETADQNISHEPNFCPVCHSPFDGAILDSAITVIDSPLDAVPDKAPGREDI